MNSRHKEHVRSRGDYIRIYECVKNIYHSTYERMCTATDSIKELYTSFIEDLLKYKSDSEDLKNCIANFEELKSRAANITGNISIHPQDKKVETKTTKRTIVR